MRRQRKEELTLRPVLTLNLNFPSINQQLQPPLPEREARERQKRRPQQLPGGVLVVDGDQEKQMPPAAAGDQAAVGDQETIPDHGQALSTVQDVGCLPDERLPATSINLPLVRTGTGPTLTSASR